MGQPEAGTAGQVGLGFPDLAGFYLIQHDSLSGDNLPVDHHPVVVRRVARSAHA